MEGTDNETIQECCLLACSLWCVQLSFLYSPGPHTQEWHCPRWSGPSHINQHLRKYAIDIQTHRPIQWREFLSWGFFLQVCKVKAKDNNDTMGRVRLNSKFLAGPGYIHNKTRQTGDSSRLLNCPCTVCGSRGFPETLPLTADGHFLQRAREHQAQRRMLPLSQTFAFNTMVSS